MADVFTVVLVFQMCDVCAEALLKRTGESFVPPATSHKPGSRVTELMHPMLSFLINTLSAVFNKTHKGPMQCMRSGLLDSCDVSWWADIK